MRTPAVPRFDDAAIQAEADLNRRGDCEKVATTPTTYLEIDGVGISSRYDKAHEFDSMAGMINGLEEQYRRLVESIWCDSKADAWYNVKLRPCTVRQARDIAALLDQDCCKHDGGHNGITVEGSHGGRLHLESNWSAILD